MTEEKKPLKVIFEPGCFDSFEGTQEELDEMIAEIHRLVESGELMEKAEPIDVDSILEEFTDEELDEMFEEMLAKKYGNRTLQ